MGKFCPQCGAQSVDDANYCMRCGYCFNEVKVVLSASQPAEPAAPVQKTKAAGSWIQNSGVVNPNPVDGYTEYNPTFHCKCEYCYFEFDYHVYDLGHRAWYPHGFVYCPRCQRPLRHKLEYEVITRVSPEPSADRLPAVISAGSEVPEI